MMYYDKEMPVIEKDTICKGDIDIPEISSDLEKLHKLPKSKSKMKVSICSKKPLTQNEEFEKLESSKNVARVTSDLAPKEICDNAFKFDSSLTDEMELTPSKRTILKVWLRFDFGWMEFTRNVKGFVQQVLKAKEKGKKITIRVKLTDKKKQSRPMFWKFINSVVWERSGERHFQGVLRPQKDRQPAILATVEAASTSSASEKITAGEEDVALPPTPEIEVYTPGANSDVLERYSPTPLEDIDPNVHWSLDDCLVPSIYDLFQE